jgi:hypothetical protein
MGKPGSLSPEQRRALDRLTSTAKARGLYLAGGSGIAVHLHHRQSRDLDLFTQRSGARLEDLRDALVTAGQDVQVVAITDATLAIRFEGCAVDVVLYPYGLLDPLVAGPGGFPTASLRDLAAMKLSAVARRGIARDFWDLHEIFTRTEVTLRVAIEGYREKFGVAESDVYHVLKSLTYFEDAERDPLPAGLTGSHFSAIKRYFEQMMNRKPWR